MRSLRRFLAGEEATTAVEYAVMLGLILIACITALSSLGSESGGLWGNNNAQLRAHGF